MDDLPHSDPPRLNFCLDNRLFEWVMGIALLGTGLIMLGFPNSIVQSQLYNMLNLGPSWVVGVVYLCVGILRVTSLLIKDEYWSRHGRAASAFLSSMIWFHTVAAFVLLIPVREVPSPSMAMYCALVVAEWYSTYRVMARK